MLAYSANRSRVGTRSSSPNMMLAIIGIHVGAVAVLMSARMELPAAIKNPPLTIDFIKPKPPEPVAVPDVPKQQAATRPQPSFTAPDQVVPIPADSLAIPVPDPLPPLPGSIDPSLPSVPATEAAKPIAATPAILVTGAAELKPPYPASKLASGEEADLKLRLTVDERGRVTAVEPMGRADSAFLSAARRHIMAHWRYRPATSDGRGVTTTLVITLRFRLDD